MCELVGLGRVYRGNEGFDGMEWLVVYFRGFLEVIGSLVGFVFVFRCFIKGS